MDTFGIPRNHIFNSRDSSFLPSLKNETGGRGVDLVLNSLSGELLHASWECVADFGKMLEIGKRDFIGRGHLDMAIFEANRSFFGIDLAKLGVEKPEICQRWVQNPNIKHPILTQDWQSPGPVHRILSPGAHWANQAYEDF